MTVAAVVFDVGNVLLEWNPDRFYDQKIGPERRRALFGEVDLMGMNELLDLGAPFRDTVYAWADQFPKWGDEIRMWHDNWLDTATPDIPQTAQVLSALKTKGLPVYALTNFARETWRIAQGAYPVLTQFDQCFVSGDLKLAKPDPAIYAHLEASVSQSPDTLLFTDDRSDNIAAAHARGWYTHLFDGTQGLANRLIQEGVLDPDDLGDITQPAL